MTSSSAVYSGQPNNAEGRQVLFAHFPYRGGFGDFYYDRAEESICHVDAMNLFTS